MRKHKPGLVSRVQKLYAQPSLPVLGVQGLGAFLSGMLCQSSFGKPTAHCECESAWNGSLFVRTSLKVLGLRVQFGHPPGEYCMSPEAGRKGFVVLHNNGIDKLLHRGWYPSSEECPQTCMTFEVLELFRIVTLQAKMTMYDYYRSLERLTQNNGVQPPGRYRVFCWEYQYLLLLKHGGQGHNLRRVKATNSGDLAVRFLYIFFTLDACFHLKRLMIPNEFKDPGLGTGWVYMLENTAFWEYLLTVTDQKEMTTCSGLAALDYANTKFHEVTAPPVWVWVFAHGTSSCSRTGRGLAEGGKLKELPPLVRCFLILPMICFMIPKMHIKGHGPGCGLFLLNLKLGSRQTNGEGIKRPWSNIGEIVTSTRIMGPGVCHDTINDHWSYWNWQKLVSLVSTLHKHLDNAREQEVVQQEALDSFLDQQQDHIEQWKAMVHDFEKDSSKKNPYEMVVVGIPKEYIRSWGSNMSFLAGGRGCGAQGDSSQAPRNPKREVQVKAELKKSKTMAQQIDMAVLQTKLLRRLNRLRKLQGTYCPGAIVVLEKREAPEDEQPENEPLFLPSALSEAECADGSCVNRLLEMELLHNQLIIKGRFLNYKAFHAQHQGATTCAFSIVNRNKLKIQLHSEKYQVAWNALWVNAGQDEWLVGLKKLRKEDIRCMEDAEDLAAKEAKRRKAKARRKRKYDKLIAHVVEVPAWLNAEEEEGDRDGEGDNAEGRVGESQGEAYAQARKWKEEVRLLTEEFRRLPISLEFEADLLQERAKAVPVGSSELQDAYVQGMITYALKQEALFRDIATRARQTETAMKKVGTDAAREEDNDDDDNGQVAGEEADGERGVIESDEELVMGGEVDNI
ncbi:hypothetical protein B0H14DRAFT_2574911 [Mycena olivaceomarginata]|nr:hypothetical protein B0H14DRAFT_2574911 [Mycena olivaceomarginata]